ncbi:hypothetical protein PSACC_01896 [Paramicrosporidium saccamoebae]|uniref:Wings apart-like protein C-terminal domain-containing protein n=1 Tax=Paramicrosporidium saccamoebae TaxID=1246581 RepID=A0A2H9TKL0_9FUNG|nr:hypothetical protein PSACC_01896 [Paramicrosporidium saccamoebae]
MIGFIEEEPKKRPENTYSRRGVVKRESLKSVAVGEECINDTNFVKKMLEVFQPTVTSKPVDSESEQGEEEEDSIKRHCVRNVHELLESGGSCRLYDELDYLITGVEALPVGARSNSARNTYLYDLGSKILEDNSPLRTSKLRSSGYLERIISSLVNVEDDYGRRFLLLLLFRLCDDVRRIDHFINVTAGLRLAEWALQREGTLADPTTTPRLERLFAKPYIPALIFATQTSEQSAVLDFRHVDLIAGLINMAKTDVRMSRTLYILEYLGSVGKEVATCVDAVAGCLFADLSAVEMLPLVQTLVSLTGPDEGAERLSRHPKVESLGHLLMAAECQDVQIMLCILIANVVDRYTEARKVFLEDARLVVFLCKNCATGKDLGAYYGMLLGILASEERGLQSALEASNAGLMEAIRLSFDTLLQTLTDSGKLDSALKLQLTSFRSIYG